ncbi:hypothetical protein CQ018_12815 [Arthrobacter sp. MYb227]|nr:hypothetical protein CQ018_12815 [Arthrobacter sp. MYb227]
MIIAEGPQAPSRGESSGTYDEWMREKPDTANSSKRAPIYVEILVRAPMERVWKLTQDSDLHPRWDLRFSKIVPLGHGEDGPVDFRYEFHLPLYAIHGTGTSLVHRHRADGQATSVLKFDTADPLSPIGRGSGYWRYIPTRDGIRFITGYNYRPGMGLVGKALDSSIFRPALGWATALSFDRLRLWAESGVDPRTARNRWSLDAGARTGGMLAAWLLLRRARMTSSNGVALAGVAAALSAFTVLSHWTVPRARRCLRRAPDARAARAPSTLAGLKTNDERGAGVRPMEGDENGFDL